MAEADRSSGVQVSPPTIRAGLAVNKMVDVRGTMQTDSIGERCIGNADVTVTGDGHADGIMPLGLDNKASGGGDWLYNDITKAGQKGVSGGWGANNIGLLVRVWGRITSSGTGFIVIDDGSVVPIRVDTTRLTSPPTSGYVAVTGISSLYTGYARLVIARGNCDIRVF